jgi:mRNA interferase MazF
MGLVTGPARSDVYLVNLDPTVGREIKKARPAAVVSPDEMNRHLRTTIIAPLTTTVRGWPSRVAVRFQGKAGEVALDHLRIVDNSRLVKRVGRLTEVEATRVVDVLLRMFA